MTNDLEKKLKDFVTEYVMGMSDLMLKRKMEMVSITNINTANEMQRIELADAITRGCVRPVVGITKTKLAHARLLSILQIAHITNKN